ncbi:RNA polymerase sigma factor [Deinococcus ruber]|uniref:RNA polymerase sigma factor n=1 Tax=Deinococcus ruber TaxID=1848197 RepID=UPI00166F3190|nr:sigma-70 family RNA polymerase sigma factor [Deinococcus ruber]
MRDERRNMPAGTAPARKVAAVPVPAPVDEDDTALLARFVQRDQLALATLYDRYSGAAYGLALQVLRDQSAAQETVHDAFMKLWERPALFDPARAAFSTFLLTIVRNAAISRLRGVRFTQSLEDEEGQPLPFADERVNLPERAEEQAQSSRIVAALATLKPVQRETVERAFYRGESREEIAEAMAVPVGTVKSRLKYALDRLRGLLESEGDEL